MVLYEYKFFQERKWLKVFYHDIRAGIHFNTIDDARYLVGDENRFSILSEITDRDKIHNYFYFLFEFNSSDLFVSWRQFDNPLTISEKDIDRDSVPGFRILSTNCNNTQFGGLAKTYREPCIPSLLSGNINHHRWYYAVGVIADCDGDYEHAHRLPGPSYSEVYQTTLWMQVPYYTCLRQKITFRFIFTTIFLLIEQAFSK